jgi:hypothetical protein
MLAVKRGREVRRESLEVEILPCLAVCMGYKRSSDRVVDRRDAVGELLTFWWGRANGQGLDLIAGLGGGRSPAG